MRERPWRPTAKQLRSAHGKEVPDVIAPGLRVLFVGINPGLYSAAVGHHFGRPGNRFWQALHAGGFTERVYSPFEDGELIALGYGITNVVARATGTADELRDEEMRAGARVLERKVREYRPRVVAFLGVGAYRTAFGRPRAKLGKQEEKLGDAEVWVLPNPSGLNAHYDLRELAQLFRQLRRAVEENSG